MSTFKGFINTIYGLKYLEFSHYKIKNDFKDGLLGRKLCETYMKSDKKDRKIIFENDENLE